MDKVANPSPALPGEVRRYAFGQNRAMARELIRWATPEQMCIRDSIFAVVFGQPGSTAAQISGKGGEPLALVGNLSIQNLYLPAYSGRIKPTPLITFLPASDFTKLNQV